MSNYKDKMLLLMFFIFFILKTSAVNHYIEVNYDIDIYKILNVNETLELICKNKLNRNPPSWQYPRRMANNPRVKFNIDIGESRMVISNAEAEDAGKYGCAIDHDYEGKTIHFNKEIQVIGIDVSEVKVEETANNFTLNCDVHGYPAPEVTWKIDYDKKELNPHLEQYDEHSMPEYKVVVKKSEGRLTLQPYKGVNKAQLIIANATENDNGKYFCFAKNYAGEQCKDCIVTKSKRAVQGNSTTATPSHTREVETKPDNLNKGLAAGSIALIALVPIAVLIVALIAFHRIKSTRKETENTEERIPMEGVNEDEIVISESAEF